MLHGVFANEDFQAQISYIFDLFFSIYGIEWQVLPVRRLPEIHVGHQDVVISYGQQKPEQVCPHHIHIYASDFFGSDFLKPASMPQSPIRRFGYLPIIYQGTPVIEGHVRREGGVIETDIDIIASSFFMLVRYEEMLTTERDRFGRFPAAASVAYQEGFLHQPVVNSCIDLLWDWISTFAVGLARRQLWQGNEFAACITHDIDRLSKYGLVPPLRRILNLALRQRKLRLAVALAADYLKDKVKRNSFNTFDYLMDLAEAYRVKSSFFFMSGGDTAHDTRYAVNDARVTALMGRIMKNGHEVGLHSSFNAYNDSDMLKTEKETLEAALGVLVHGSRQHYLLWATPDSWRAREEAGFHYDASLAFADHAGFRCGMCFPYKPFDVLQNRRLDIWEVPLTVMDTSLFGYQGLGAEEAKQSTISLIEEARKHHGLFMLLWHNVSVDELKRPGAKYVYEAVLEYLMSQSVYNDTIAELVKRWEDLTVRGSVTKIC